MIAEDGVEDFLSHYGVKGMKWGVVRSDDQLAGAGGSAKEPPKGSSGSSKESSKSGKSSKELSSDDMAKVMDEFYKNKTDAQLKAEGKRKLAEQAAMEFPHKPDNPKYKSSLDTKASELKSGGLTRNQKIALGVGAAAAAGALAYYVKQQNKSSGGVTNHGLGKSSGGVTNHGLGKSSGGVTNHGLGKSVIDNGKYHEERKVNAKNLGAEWESLFGRSVNPSANEVHGFKGFFYQGLKSKGALDRPEFTIPKTFTFQRLSNHAETGEGYGNGTYATFLSNDKKMYGQSSEFGGKKYTLTFQPTDDVRVPSTKTVLSELKNVMQANGKTVSDSQVFSTYHHLSGGSWKSPEAQSLISNLKGKGYSALVDDMDAGFMGDLPVVFFGGAQQVNATPRTLLDKQNDKKTAVPLVAQYA